MFGGTSVSAPAANPFLTMSAVNNLNQSGNQFQQANAGYQQANAMFNQGPITTLPASMQSNVNLPSAVQQGNQADANLPSFLQMNSSNPLFGAQGQQLANNYSNLLFNNSVAPQLGSAAEQQWLGGNLGTNGSSSFGADYLSNLDASGRVQSALGGQQYYTNDLNNFLNERNNYFSNNVQPALQASEFNQQQNLSALGMLNSQQLGAASGLAGDAAGMANIGNGYNNTGNSYMGWANQQQQMGLQASAASAANKSNFITGLGGLAGGLVNSAMPSNGLSGLFGSGPGSLGGASGGSPSVVGPGTSFGSILPSVSSNYGLSF